MQASSAQSEPAACFSGRDRRYASPRPRLEPAGQRLCDAINASIVELAAFSQRDYVVEEDDDIEITYSRPTLRLERRATLELTLMLGGAWFTCRDLGVEEHQVRQMSG